MGPSNNTEERDKPEIKRPLTREEKRANERTNADAQAVYKQITERFLDAFIAADDPQSEGIKIYKIHLSKQWRMYCQRKHLLPKAYPMVDDYIKGVFEQYKTMSTDESPREEERA